MGFLSKAIKSGIALKAVDVVRREVAKPENQRKAKELLQKARNSARKRCPAAPAGRLDGASRPDRLQPGSALPVCMAVPLTTGGAADVADPAESGEGN